MHVCTNRFPDLLGSLYICPDILVSWRLGNQIDRELEDQGRSSNSLSKVFPFWRPLDWFVSSSLKSCINIPSQKQTMPLKMDHPKRTTIHFQVRTGRVYLKFPTDPCLGDTADEPKPCTTVLVNNPSPMFYTVFLVSPARKNRRVHVFFTIHDRWEKISPSLDVVGQREKNSHPQPPCFFFVANPRFPPHVCI